MDIENDIDSVDTNKEKPRINVFKIAVIVLSIVIITVTSILIYVFLIKDNDQSTDDHQTEGKKDAHSDKSSQRIEDDSLSGSIDNDQTWSGTITITGDLSVSENVTITIEPGTNVLITSNQDDTQSGGFMHQQCQNLEEGETCPFEDPDFGKRRITLTIPNIIAKGDNDNWITITSTTQETPYDWESFYINKAEFEYTEISNYVHMGVAKSLFMKNCKIHTTLDASVVLRTGAEAEITECEFYSCGNECIFNGGDIVVTNSIFKPEFGGPHKYQYPSQGFANGGTGKLDGTTSTALLIGNTFSHGTGYLCAEYPSKATLSNNTFINGGNIKSAVVLGEDIPNHPMSGKYECTLTFNDNILEGYSNEPGKTKPFMINPLEMGKVTGSSNEIENYTKSSSKESFFEVPEGANLSLVEFNQEELLSE